MAVLESAWVGVFQKTKLNLQYNEKNYDMDLYVSHIKEKGFPMYAVLGSNICVKTSSPFIYMYKEIGIIF